jgi:GntR family transcriptional regulator
MAEPMYRQIADDLQRKIESGEWPPGSQLPTEIDLREQHQTSRNTVRDAIKWLTTRGSVETRPGQGTFVTERLIPFVTTLTSPLSRAMVAGRAASTSPGCWRFTVIR